jgi:hypothetical protein
MPVLEIPGGRGAGRVAFKAIEAVVREKVLAGWTLTAIFARHREQLAGIKYGQFRSYVRRYVEAARHPRSARQPPPWSSEPRVPELPPRPAEAPTLRIESPADIARFASQPVDLEQLARSYKKSRKS